MDTTTIVALSILAVGFLGILVVLPFAVLRRREFKSTFSGREEAMREATDVRRLTAQARRLNVDPASDRRSAVLCAGGALLSLLIAFWSASSRGFTVTTALLIGATLILASHAYHLPGRHEALRNRARFASRVATINRRSFSAVSGVIILILLVRMSPLNRSAVLTEYVSIPTMIVLLALLGCAYMAFISWYLRRPK